jgi:predicted dehydrogenase
MKKTAGVTFEGVCAATGLSAQHAGGKFGFRYCTTDEGDILGDTSINTVAIATRHHLHARQVIAALEAGKQVYCEKPLCIREEELREIVQTQGKPDSPGIWVGFNRRFSRLAGQLKEFLEPVQGPIVMSYRVNAGPIALDHWTQDPGQGGGRIVGEVCHFIDFLSFLAGALPAGVRAIGMPNGGVYNDDNVTLTIDFSDGSVGTIIYAAGGDTAMAKERVEVFGGGRSAVLDDFRRLDTVHGGRSRSSRSRFSQDKGHLAQWEAFRDMVVQGVAPAISLTELVATTLTTFRALESLQTGQAVRVGTDEFISSAMSGDPALDA